MKNKGFTLAELLIVVAIIAVLVGISIPVFTNQLEKSREATDLANVRSAYAELMVTVLSQEIDENNEINVSESNGSMIYETSVDLKQKNRGWQSTLPITIGSVTSNDKNDGDNGIDWIGIPGPDGVCTLTYSEEGLKLNWSGDGETIINPPKYTANVASCWTYSTSTAGAIGKQLVNKQGSSWANKTTAVNEAIDVKVGDELSFENLPQEYYGSQGLQVGFFVVDPNDGAGSMTIVNDSGGKNLNSKYTVANTYNSSTENLKVYIQIITPSNSTVAPTEEQVSQIMSKLVIKSK